MERRRRTRPTSSTSTHRRRRRHRMLAAAYRADRRKMEELLACSWGICTACVATAKSSCRLRTTRSRSRHRAQSSSRRRQDEAHQGRGGRRRRLCRSRRSALLPHPTRRSRLLLSPRPPHTRAGRRRPVNPSLSSSSSSSSSSPDTLRHAHVDAAPRTTHAHTHTARSDASRAPLGCARGRQRTARSLDEAREATQVNKARNSSTRPSASRGWTASFMSPVRARFRDRVGQWPHGPPRRARRGVRMRDGRVWKLRRCGGVVARRRQRCCL